MHAYLHASPTTTTMRTTTHYVYRNNPERFYYKPFGSVHRKVHLGEDGWSHIAHIDIQGVEHLQSKGGQDIYRQRAPKFSVSGVFLRRVPL